MIRGFRRRPAGVNWAPARPVDAEEAFDQGVALERRGDLLAAEEAYDAADRNGHAGAPVKLGVLLEERDDFAGAEQAFRRADDRGDATGAFHLGWMLQERGDVAGAEEAYRRAEARGHLAAEANLRVLRTRPARRRPGTAPSPRAVAAAEPSPVPDRTAAAAASQPPDPVPDSEADTAAHSIPAAVAATSAAATEPPPATNRERGAGALLQRTASIVLPVAAFAIAFLAGDATRAPVHTSSHLAPATNVSDSTVRLSTVAPVPRPAKLITKPPAGKPGTPATTAVPGAVSLRSATPAPPVYRASAPVTPSTAPAGATAATPTAGATVAGTNGGGAPVNGTTTSSTTPSGG